MQKTLEPVEVRQAFTDPGRYALTTAHLVGYDITFKTEQDAKMVQAVLNEMLEHFRDSDMQGKFLDRRERTGAKRSPE